MCRNDAKAKTMGNRTMKKKTGRVFLSVVLSFCAALLTTTIQAADKNDVIVKDYTGTILIFSESDADAELPSALDQNTYIFMDSDQ